MKKIVGKQYIPHVLLFNPDPTSNVTTQIKDLVMFPVTYYDKNIVFTTKVKLLARYD